MIISIYGIPRSGKDTFINGVLARNNNSIHVKGSETLNELAIFKYGCKFKQLDEERQKQIRIAFTKRVNDLKKDYQTILVDGHYSFPKQNGYNIVFTEEDLKLYDAFFYLKRTGEEIARNFNSDNKIEYSEYLLSKEKAEEWIEFEIKNMQKQVENSEKDFVVLDSNSLSLDFVCAFNKKSSETAKDIANGIKAFAGGRKVILTDLDKTVSINDLTNDFIEDSSLDPLFPKKIFKGDYYTQYQFWRFHKYLLDSKTYEKSIDYSLSKICLNNNLVRDLEKLKKANCVVALTTGMVDAWRIINEKINLFEEIIGFSKDKNIIITPFIKKLVSKYLSKTNEVMAIGDSIIDLGMILESKKGYLVAMTKLDKRIINAQNRGEINKKIYQPSYSLFKYDFVKEDDIKW